MCFSLSLFTPFSDGLVGLLKSTGIACLLAILLPSITCGVASSHNVKQCVTQNKKSPCLYILSISTHECHVGYCNVYI